MPFSDIKVRTFTGQGIKTYLPSIAKLRLEILKEYPELFEGEIEKEKRYLKKYTQTPDAIAVIVFDGSTVVGASTGIPLIHESKEIQKPFLENGHDPRYLFYLDESVLLKPYRGRGIGHYFFDLREEHIINKKRFAKICFFSVERPDNHPKKPSDYMPLYDFWTKRGYSARPEIACALTWKDIGEKTKSTKPLLAWIKNLTI